MSPRLPFVRATPFLLRMAFTFVSAGLYRGPCTACGTDSSVLLTVAHNRNETPFIVMQSFGVDTMVDRKGTFTNFTQP
jgi:hypothetical protein